jgi:hypothetical protein
LRLCTRCCKSSHAPQAKRCEECGVSLPPGRKTLKFCSVACRQKAHRRGLAITDLEGGGLPGPDTPVSVTPAQLNQILTDPPIRNTAPASRCVACRREFRSARKDTKFCSPACKQRTHRLGKLRQHALEGAELDEVASSAPAG